jgi:hypothetical protein
MAYTFKKELNTLLEFQQTGEVKEEEQAFDYSPYLTEAGEVNKEAIEARIKGLYSDEAYLIEDTARIFQDVQAKAEELKAQEKALATRRKALEGRAEYLESLLSEAIGGKKWQSPKSSMQIAVKETTAVQIEDMSKVPESFIRTKVVKEVDKIPAKKLLEAGEEVPGLFLEYRKHLTVK